MFLFIVYGVGPRHHQNMGYSKSTAKAQLRDAPSVKAGKTTHLLCCLAAAIFLSPNPVILLVCLRITAQSHSTRLPHRRPDTSQTTGLKEGWSILTRSPRSRVLRISQEQAVKSSKRAKPLSWPKPRAPPWAQGFPSSSNFHYALSEPAAVNIEKRNKI